MGTVKVTILHCDWRDGRPRFNPGPRLRGLGFTGQDLRDGKTGPWWTLEQVRAWHPTILAEIAEREKAAKPKALPAATILRRPGLITVAELFARMFKDDETLQVKGPDFVGKRRIEKKSASTIDGYRINSRVLEKWDVNLAASPVEDITLDIAKGIHKRLEEDKGRSMARAVMAVLSRAITWGMGQGLCFKGKAHPMANLTMPVPAPRLRIGEIHEIEALCAAADAIGLPEGADAVYLGVFTGQRQADRLEMADSGMIGNRRRFVQLKTKAVVSVVETPQLAARLTQAFERKKQWDVVPASVLVASSNGKPLTKATYRKIYVAMRDAAVNGVPDEDLYIEPLQLPENATAQDRLGAIARAQGRNEPAWKVAPCPSLADFTDQDLRDTAVTWLALAGSTVPEIIAVTGHSATAATEILKHYLGRHPELADHAIAKMVLWLEKEGAGL
jgi:hypothetical protein